VDSVDNRVVFRTKGKVKLRLISGILEEWKDFVAHSCEARLLQNLKQFISLGFAVLTNI